MRCVVTYTHHRNGSFYYFVDFRIVDGVMKPIGCFPCRKSRATVFESKHDAEDVVQYLRSLGCAYCRVRPV